MIAACFSCSQEDGSLLAAHMVPQSFGHQETVARKGERSTHIYLVLEGRVSADLFGLDGQYAQLAGYGAGELFGAYPLETTHRADLTAQGKVQLLAIEAARLCDLAADNNGIAIGLSQLFSRQIDILLDRMAARIGLTAAGRCYHSLLAMADKDGWIRPAPVIAALAIRVNTSRETASRAFAVLQRRGIIERDHDGLRIVSRRLLEEMVI